MNEKILTEIFDAVNFDQDQRTAKVYGLTYLDDKMVAKYISENGDIYDLIDNLGQDKIVENSNYDYLTFITHGWAAPLNKNGEMDGAPSNHPDRQRVRLIVAADTKNRNNMASVMQFEKDLDNLIFDYGNATGALADAISELIS